MRRGMWGVLLALVAVSALGTEIRLEASADPAPTVPLAGTFRVVMAEATETTGTATLVVLRTGTVVRVSLKRVGDRLESEPIHVSRSCDPAPAPAVVVELGDTIVIATEAGGGRCAMARVGPRDPGQRVLAVDRLNNDSMVWERAIAVEPALFRVTLHDLSLDTTCGADRAAVELTVGETATTLQLTEDAGTSGRFVVEIAVSVRPDGSDLKLLVTDVDKKALLETQATDGGVMRLQRGDLAVQLPVALLPVQLSAEEVTLPLPCSGELRVVQPTKPDEVRWFVDGAIQHAQGTTFPLCPDTPRTLRVAVLVRQGLRWGRAEATVVFVPPVKVSFVAADGATPVEGPWSHGEYLRVKIENVRGELRGIVVGRLGPAPRPCELPVEAVGGGTFLSIPFRPADLGFCGGDALWAQVVDPRGCSNAYDVLQLR